MCNVFYSDIVRRAAMFYSQSFLVNIPLSVLYSMSLSHTCAWNLVQKQGFTMQSKGVVVKANFIDWAYFNNFFLCYLKILRTFFMIYTHLYIVFIIPILTSAWLFFTFFNLMTSSLIWFNEVIGREKPQWLFMKWINFDDYFQFQTVF